jgi:hypothetical protein
MKKEHKQNLSIVKINLKILLKISNQISKLIRTLLKSYIRLLQKTKNRTHQDPSIKVTSSPNNQLLTTPGIPPVSPTGLRTGLTKTPPCSPRSYNLAASSEGLNTICSSRMTQPWTCLRSLRGSCGASTPRASWRPHRSRSMKGRYSVVSIKSLLNHLVIELDEGRCVFNPLFCWVIKGFLVKEDWLLAADC